jgi:hypothetical protein
VSPIGTLFLLVGVVLFARALRTRRADPRRGQRLAAMASGYLVLAAATRPDIPRPVRLSADAVGLALVAYGALTISRRPGARPHERRGERQPGR